MLSSKTNNILKEQTEKQTVYYVPAYLRMKVKNFTAMDLGSLDAEVNSTVIFTVFYGELDEGIVQVLSENIVFLFNRNDALQLKEGLETKFTRNKKERTFSFTIRKLFSARISTNVFWSPFEVANLVLSITVQSVNVNTDKHKCVIKFNLMNHESTDLKLSTSESGAFGSYDLAEHLLDVEYSNNSVASDVLAQQMKREELVRKEQQKKKAKQEKKRGFNQSKTNDSLLSPNNLIQPVNDKQVQKQVTNGAFVDTVGPMNSNLIKLKTKQNLEATHKTDGVNQERKVVRVTLKKIEDSKSAKGPKGPKQFQYAHFNIPLYKYPLVTVVTIFLPLWLLSIINLGIFFQVSSLHDRIASIAGVMIAFVALVPTIRSQLPPSPTITIVQILVYLQTLTSLFCLIQSISIRQIQGYAMIWYESGLFVASAIITLISIMVVTSLCIIHKLYWQPLYNKPHPKAGGFSIKEWKNQACDNHFQAFSNVKIFSKVEDFAIDKKAK